MVKFRTWQETRLRYLRLADHDLLRYREIRDAQGKTLQTFLAGATYFYKKAGLGKKAAAVKRLLRYIRRQAAKEA